MTTVDLFNTINREKERERERVGARWSNTFEHSMVNNDETTTQYTYVIVWEEGLKGSDR